MKILLIFVVLLEANRCFGWEPAPASEPTNAWNMKCSAKFKELGINTSFARPTAHILHRLSVEDVKFFFNVDIPAENGIPTQNQNLNASEAEMVLDNAPSRPTGSLSYGYHAFSVTMDNIDVKDWDVRGNTLEKLLHSFHLQELLAKTSDSTDQWHDVPDDACACALDTEGNGIIKELKVKFEFLRDGFNSPAFNSVNGIPELTDHSSWLVWKDWKKPGGFHNAKYLVFQGWDDADAFKNAGLYMHCALKKFKGCCKTKTVGQFSYTIIGTGEVPGSCKSNCIYQRDGQAGSRYCFATGQQLVTCNDVNGQYGQYEQYGQHE